MKGLRVDDIQSPSGNAAKAGIIVDDIIAKVNDREVETVDSLIAIMQSNEGQECQFEIICKGELKTIVMMAGPLGLSLIPIDIEYKYYEAKSGSDPTLRKMSEDRYELHKKIGNIQLTTAPSLEGYRIVKTETVIGAECAFGMNVFKDIFTSVTDFTGGRSGALQNTLRDARNRCLEDLRLEAYEAGANAVVAVDIDYSEFSGGGRAMLFVAASGTAVIVEPLEDLSK